MMTHEEISKRAREIWEREGRPEGRDMEHWFQAEAELRRPNTAVQTAAKTAPAPQAVSPSENPMLQFPTAAKDAGARKRVARRAR